MLYRCWNREPESRPTFKEVVEILTAKSRLITPLLEDPSTSVKSYNNVKISQQNVRRPSLPIVKSNAAGLLIMGDVESSPSTFRKAPDLPPRNGTVCHNSNNHNHRLTWGRNSVDRAVNIGSLGDPLLPNSDIRSNKINSKNCSLTEQDFAALRITQL